jgi:LIM domain
MLPAKVLPSLWTLLFEVGARGLLTLLRQASVLQEEVKAAGGFEGYIIRGFTVPPASAGSSRDVLSLTPLVTKFEPEVYVSLMEILIDNVVKPSESLFPSKVETFGKLLVRPEQLKLLFRLLPSADWQLKHDVMKDLNVLLVQRPDNFPRILEQPEWMSWLAPLLANLPRKANDRDELMNEYLKYVMNFFIMLLARAFSTAGASGDMDRCLGRFMAQIKMQCGWTEAVVGVMRNLMATLAQKVQTTADRWQRKYDRPEWENLFKLATVVEDFIFYRPVNTDSDGDMSELLAPSVVYMAPNMLHPASQMPIAPATVDPLDKSTPGLHLNMQTGEADDLKLAQRVVALFSAAGLTGDAATDPNVARATDKKAKDLLVHANSIMKIMKEIVAFLEDCNKSRLLGNEGSGNQRAGKVTSSEEAEKALFENLAKFLEKRQKQQKTGFLSRSATKKGIVQALQTNVMRQRAQQTVRAQVQATLMAKATVTTVTIEDDDEDDAPSGARTGTTAKRLQGTRAAVEQLAAQQQQPSAGAAATVGGGAARPAVTSLRSGTSASEYSLARGASESSSSMPSTADSSVVAAAAAEAVKASIAHLDIEGQGEVDDVAASAGAAGAGASGGAATGGAEGADSAAGDATEEEQRVAEIICDRCSQPLLDDDGVMALGCKFHVNCFCCSECDVPFRDNPYYEKKGKAYCRNDYLKLFGKTVCAGCMEPLKRGQRALEAGSRVYHPEHFSCEGCGDVFAEDAQYYERDNAPYCSKCNLKLFGMCAGCNEQISGDKPAVSALNRNWHLSCIKCAACGGGFEDGVFFTSEDENGVMHAYCERDYLEIHAPRCRGCTDIIKDTGLHACGSSWHTQCFVCTVCKTAFPESNYFEVDGRPYCSNDYYNHFGTKCAGCSEFITDEVVNALGQQWHVGHFNCAKCNKPFGDFEYYEKDGKAYDEQCYCELFCPLCPVCGCYVVEEASVALGVAYHPWCLRCSHCGEQLTSTVHQASDGRLFCDQDFMALVAYTCKKCGGLIQAESVQALDAHWHPECFTCSYEGEEGEPACDANLANDESGGFHEIDGKPYCAQHHADLKCEKCAGCGRGIILGTGLSALKQNWHSECLRCFNCSNAMTDKIYSRESRPVCEECFLATAEKCAGCGKGIIGKFLSVLGRKYHPEPGCLSCTACGTALSGGNLYPRDQWPVCKTHARGDLSEEENTHFNFVKQRYDDAVAATKTAQEGLAATLARVGGAGESS